MATNNEIYKQRKNRKKPMYYTLIREYFDKMHGQYVIVRRYAPALALTEDGDVAIPVTPMSEYSEIPGQEELRRLSRCFENTSPFYNNKAEGLSSEGSEIIAPWE